MLCRHRQGAAAYRQKKCLCDEINLKYTRECFALNSFWFVNLTFLPMCLPCRNQPQHAAINATNQRSLVATYASVAGCKIVVLKRFNRSLVAATRSRPRGTDAMKSSGGSQDAASPVLLLLLAPRLKRRMHSCTSALDDDVNLLHFWRALRARASDP